LDKIDQEFEEALGPIERYALRFIEQNQIIDSSRTKLFASNKTTVPGSDQIQGVEIDRGNSEPPE